MDGGWRCQAAITTWRHPPVKGGRNVGPSGDSTPRGSLPAGHASRRVRPLTLSSAACLGPGGSAHPLCGRLAVVDSVRAADTRAESKKHAPKTRNIVGRSLRAHLRACLWNRRYDHQDRRSIRDAVHWRRDFRNGYDRRFHDSRLFGGTLGPAALAWRRVVFRHGAAADRARKDPLLLLLLQRPAGRRSQSHGSHQYISPRGHAVCGRLPGGSGPPSRWCSAPFSLSVV